MPINVTELVTAIFYGIATLCIPVATVYLMFVAARTKRVEVDLSKVKDNVELIERNTNSLTTQLKTAARANGVVEGEKIGQERGEELAKKLAQGQREGRDVERAGVAAKGTSSPPSGERPLPVEDDKMAEVGERIAKATEVSADAQKRVATAAEEKK